MELVFRFQLQPSLGTFATHVATISVDEDALLRVAFPGADLDPLNAEARSCVGNVTENAVRDPPNVSLSYPALFGMEDRHLSLIYKAVRLARPGRVVETGVADGRSSRAILAALSANGAGRLTSLDVADDVGGLIEPGLRDRWDLVVLPRTGQRDALRRCLSSLAPVDIFIHDSDHSYGWQSLEYRIGYQALRPGGLLISDDIDASFAFLDFVSRQAIMSLACVGSRKVMGVALKPAADHAANRSPS